VAIRKNNKKSVSRGAQVVVVFWIIFVIVIISVFIANSQTIFKNLKILFPGETSVTEEDLLAEDQLQEVQIGNDRPAPVITIEPAADPAATVQPSDPVRTEDPPVQTQQQTQQQTQPQQQQTQTSSQQQNQPQQQAAQDMRTRVFYFAQVDRDGQIRQSRVTRRLPASNTPLQDALNAMLVGPNPGELSGNLLSFIPQNTRLLSVTIRGSTAYVNFSDDFRFNKFGVEGYIAQLRQVVWTVTEFENIRDVQILIQGRVIDYLGEGIFIGAPLSRQSF